MVSSLGEAEGGSEEVAAEEVTEIAATTVIKLTTERELPR